jgi:PLP dependent protein
MLIGVKAYLKSSNFRKVKESSQFISIFHRMASDASSSSSTPATAADPHVLDPETLINNYLIVKQKIEGTLSSMTSPQNVRLVAVSKTKPSQYIQVLYDQGHRDFGENYFQELVDKAESLPKDIRWHFIGHLQSSKASKLIRQVPNLVVLETVDSMKLATKLQNACEASGRSSLNVFIQVDTSNEDTKSGVDVDEALSLALEIKAECPALKISGLMTIGAPGDYSCFDKLSAARDAVALGLGLTKDDLELSMGMSSDFEEAILRGATSVRVGSTLFGPRIYR